MNFWYNLIELLIIISYSQLTHQYCESTFQRAPFIAYKRNMFFGSIRYVLCENFNPGDLKRPFQNSFGDFPTSLEIRNSSLDELKADLFNSTNLRNIRNLKVSANIESITYDAFKQFDLNNLNLQQNQIKFLNNSFGNLTNLESLDLSFNKIRAMDLHSFNNLTKLKYLYLSHNNLDEWHTIYNNSNNSLVSLDLSYNQIELFRNEDVFYNLTNLQNLYLSVNKFYDLPTNLFENNRNLSALYLDRNLLIDFNLKLQSCQILNLSHNLIKNFNFDQFSFVETIDLSHNEFESFPKTSKQNLIRNLYLIDNKISRIDNFDNFVNLERLDLTNNRLVFIDTNAFYKNNQLKSLNLSMNYLNLPIYYPNSLEILILSHNNLVKFNNFTNLSNLTILDLSFNQINEIPATFFVKKLNSLKFNNNQIKSLQLGCFQHLQSLESLDLSFNLIEQLQLGIFSNLKQLEILNLSNNRLKHLPNGVFYNNKLIRSFDVSFNNFDYLDIENILIGFTLNCEIGLNGNNWSCSTLAEIIKKFKNLKFIDGHQHDVTNINGIACNDNNTITNTNRDSLELLESLNKLITIIAVILLLIFIAIIWQLLVKHLPKDLIRNRSVSEQEMSLIN